VLFDFQDVPMIGQAFADEISRVFPEQHPNVEIIPLRANPDVQGMIIRAQTSQLDLPQPMLEFMNVP